MTEQYRDGSDDDDFFSYLITAHCNENNFLFLIPLFPSLFFNTTAP